MNPDHARFALDFEQAATLSAMAISAATGASAAAIKDRLMRGGSLWPLAELGGYWAPPLNRPPAQDDLTGTYLTLDEYAEEWDAWPDGVDSSASLARHLVRTHDPEKLLWCLARMNALSSRLGNPNGLVEGYRESLPERWRSRFDEAMREEGGGLGRIVAYRQPLLAAVRYVLTSSPEDLTGTEPPTLSTAVMLSHAVGVDLNQDVGEEDEESDEAFMGGFPRWAVRTMLGGSFLGANVDVYDYVFRTLSLWKDCGPRLETYLMEKKPAELLRDATGMELEDILLAGIVAWAYDASWEPGQAQMTAKVGVGDALPQDTWDKFLRLVAATPKELRDAFAERTGPFDFFPLQSKPVLRLGNDLIVLDNDFLLERFTTGLYHSVFAYEQDNSPNPSEVPMQWVQAFGEMFELSVEDQVLAMSPNGGSGVTTVYYEEDIGSAYGEGSEQPDIAVYYGNVLVIFEVVSGRVTVPARSEGNLDAFERNIRKLVVKKFKQLGGACNNILADETKLTGRPPTLNLRIVPVVVQVDLFPSDALTLELLKNVADSTGFFQDDRIVEPSVIGPTELDMLEGLHDNKGIEPHVPLQSWKKLPKRISLHDFLVVYKYGRGLDGIYRSQRAIDRVDAYFGDILRVS